MKDQERTPLRVVLRNFLNHIENLESQNCPEKSYDAEFQDLKLFSENVKSLKEYSCLEGEKEINRKKNRYKDILPFDLSRVVLNEYAGIPGSDYINANFIKGASGSPAYIASQGPLPNTVNDFWRMVVQCEVQVIVMACNEEEAGKAKCEKYWVDEGEEKQFGMISVKLLKASTVCSDFSVRTMRLKYNNSQSTMEERTVCQLHYVAWPDHGVPTVVQPLLEMVRLVRDTQASETLPVLVHCSAGCGRTGTICAIDYVWGLLRTGKLTNNFSLLALIREMRKQRIAMVQTKEQYVLVHQAVRELFKEQLCMIDSHPYENIDTNGLMVISDEDEHVYDSIESLSKDITDEKKDNNKEKDIPPPLPKKKYSTIFPSKKEKDVENLSAQQRAIHQIPKANKNESPLKTTGKPIPAKGILRVPQLDTSKSKALGTVKRSKSLKVDGNNDKRKLMVCSELPVETKRRASLESNLDENITFCVDNPPPSHNEMSSKQIVPNITKPLKKYEDLCLIDHKKPLVRSYTTLDMKTKLSQENALNVERNAISAKVKLSRSNTQVDFSKISSKTHFHNPPNDTSVIDMGTLNTISTQSRAVGTQELVNKYRLGKDKMKEQFIRSSNGVLFDTKLTPVSLHKEINDLRKIKPNKVSPYQSILQKEIAKANQSPRNQTLPANIQVNRNQNCSVPFSNRSLNISTPHKFKDQTNSVNLELSSDKNIKKPYFCDINGSAIVNCSMNSSYTEPLYVMVPQRNIGNSTSNQLLGDQCTPKPVRIGKINSHDGQLSEHFGELTTSDQHSRSLMDKIEQSRKQKSNFKCFSKVCDKTELKDMPKNPARTNFTVDPFIPKDKMPMAHSKRMEMDGNHYDNDSLYSRCLNSNVPFTYGPITKKPLHKISSGDVRYYQGNTKLTIPNTPTHKLSTDGKQNYGLSPSTSLQQWQTVNKPQIGEENGDWNLGPLGKKSHKKSSSGYLVNPSGNNQESPNRQGLKNDTYFQSAPGVDIDQVAASISHKDSSKSNFMKVALEAFNLRHTKQQGKKDDTPAKAPVMQETFYKGKKKQQQYL
ncbi:uncharacterized protein LOC106672013 isoform X2 [Cimex lectularius]|uniref:protein-tyrosine-phosphatase n=1 Tax=Cimex lectularius TaxID=79782 RepID=A0A8I6S686_CIMLE|nr:uncharacterized protein LOC106672013 isoform X2 [Cimex lectularius]